jgi:hypothetical protein
MLVKAHVAQIRVKLAGKNIRYFTTGIDVERTDRPNLPKPLLKRLLHEDINAQQVVREPLPHIARFCSILGARAVRVKGVPTIVGIGSRE